MRVFLFVLAQAVLLTGVSVWWIGRRRRAMRQLALQLGLDFQTLVLGLPEGGALRGARGARAVAKRQRRQGITRLLARLSVSSGWAMSGSVDGVEVRLHPVRHGMGLRALFRQPLNLGLRIRTQVGLDTAARTVGMQDLRTGHDELDRLLVIQGTSEADIVALLRVATVQTPLLQTCALDGTVFVDDQGVELRVGGVPVDPVQVRPLLDVLTRTARAIDAARAANPAVS